MCASASEDTHSHGAYIFVWICRSPNCEPAWRPKQNSTSSRTSGRFDIPPAFASRELAKHVCSRTKLCVFLQVAYQDALGNAESNMRNAKARQEAYLQRAKAANQSQIGFAESEIEARDSRIDKLQKELSFLSNSKRVLEAYQGAKQEADALADELAESAQQLENMTEASAKTTAAHVAAMEAFKADMVTVRKEKSRLNSAITQLKQNLQKRVSENETTQANLATLQERANELQEKVESVVAQKAEIKRRAKERLTIAKASAEKQSKEFTEQMQANDLKAAAEMSAAQQQWKTTEEAMSADRAKVEAALQERAKELQKLESDLIEQQAASTAALESQSKAHSTALDTVEVERDKVLEEHAQALQEQQVLEQFKIAATAAASESAKERDRLQADLTSHQEQLKGANADIASHLEKLQQSEAATVELQKSKAEVQSNLEEMTEVANKHNATSTARATEIAEYTQQLSDMTGKTQNLESELRKAFDSAAALQAEKDALVASVSTHSERVTSLEASVKQQEVAQAAALDNLQERHADQVKSREAALTDAQKQHSAYVENLNADAEKRIAGLQDEWAQKLKTAANDSAAALSSLQQEFQAQQQTHKGAIQDAESSHAAAVSALTQQVVELKASVEQKDATVSTQTAKVTELDNLLQTSKAEWEARKGELTEAVQQRSQELEEKTSALAGVEKDLAEHQQQLESRTAELEAQKAAMASGETQAGVLRGQLESVESALAEQKTLLDKEKAAVVSESQKAGKLQADLDAELKRAQKLSDSLKAATTEHAEEVSKLHGVLQTQIEDGKTIAAKAATDLEEAKAAHQQAVGTLKQQMETAKAAHNAETVKLKEKLSKLSGSFDIVKAELDLAKNELKASGADAADMSAKMATLKKGTLLAKRAGEQEREAAELQQKKLAMKVKARKTQLDAARMSLLLVSAAGLFDKSSHNETNHFDVLKKCAASKQMVTVLQAVECEGELKDWHTDATRNLSSFVKSVLEDMMAKREGLMKANTEVATRAEELTNISAQLSIATHKLGDAYQEQSRIQSSMHKAELAEDDSVASLRTQYESHVASLKPLEQKQEEVLNALLTASDHDKVHAIVARRDFTGQEWTDQLKVSVNAASEGLQRAMDALAESKKLIKAAGQASTEAERKKAAMQMKRMMAKQKKQMEKDAKRASELREAETKKLMSQLEQAEKQKQEQALQVQHMSADQKLAAEEAARRHAAQTEELRKALEARQAAAKAELAAKEAELKKEMEAKAAQLAAELAAKSDAEARERLEAERRRKEAAELAAKREKDAAALSKQLQDKEAILNSLNLLSVGDIKDEGKAKMIEKMREARRQMALEKSAAAAAKAQKKTKARCLHAHFTRSFHSACIHLNFCALLCVLRMI